MDTVFYRERVLPSALTFALAPFLGVFLYGVLLPLNETAGIFAATLGTVTLGSLLWFKAPLIEVSDSTLRVGRATISRAHIGLTQVIPEEELFLAKGANLDARAFTCFQSSVKSMVQIEITDKKDPTPYWLFSTRNPEDLAAALR